jgi:hypothetical protein
MKPFIAGLVVLLFASFSFAAVSTDEIVKLSKLKTSDEVILQLIQKEGLSKPITSSDVVYLKEQGVSDRVIQYMLKLSKPAQVNSLPAQETKSTQLDNNMRSYYTTGKNGQKVLVVTNLDENGKRMGGEVPPDLEPAPQQTQQKPIPQEVRVVVENPQPQPSSEYYPEQEYPEPEYVDDRYNPPSYYPPAYPYYGAGSFYSPNYYEYPYQHNKNYRPMDPNQPHWRYDLHLDHPRPQPAPRPGPVQHGASGGVRPQPTRR